MSRCYIENARNILLVGEGNFSFSVSFIRKFSGKTVTSTCLEHTESLTDLQLENIRIIKNSGGLVYTSVDATCLPSHPDIGKSSYDLIIFNFPHIKGKMKIHENRLLLKKFFSSASKVLLPQGKISVTLCRGQSGTPADGMCRRWSDTWQIVDMAGHSDLILEDVFPFYCEDFPEYKCSGYRGGEKTFNINNSFTFVFAQSEAVPDPAQLLQRSISDFHKKLQSVHSFVKEAFSRSRILQLDHPMSRIQAEIDETLHETFKDLNNCSVDLMCTVHQWHLLFCEPELFFTLSGDIYEYLAVKSLLPSLKESHNAVSAVLFPSSHAKPKFNVHCYSLVISSSDSSVLQYLRKLLSRLFPGSSLKNHELIARSVSIPHKHSSSCTLALSERGISCKHFAKTGRSYKTCASFCEEKDAKDCFFISLCNIYAMFSTRVTSGYRVYDDVHFTVSKPVNNSALEPSDCEYMKLGTVRKFRWLSGTYTCLFMDVTSLSLLKYHVFDERILHSRLSYFVGLPKTPALDIYRSTALYPSVYTHDTSFWVSETFNECVFYALLMNTIYEYLLDVYLIDEYNDETSHRRSLCYRFEYCSVTKPLSKERARKLHENYTRKVLSELFDLDMR